MNFLLKIVEGPNKGAEIALVEGVAVTLGKSDDCDIILADPTLPDAPFTVEATASGVTFNGSALEPYHVKSIGSTAIAAGPADVAWGELVWEQRGTGNVESGTDGAEGHETAEEKHGEEAAAEPRPSEEPAPENAPKRRHGCLGCLLWLLVILLLLLGAAWFFRDALRPKVEELWGKVSALTAQWKGRQDTASGQDAQDSVTSQSTLPALAEKYGLSITNDAGRTVLSGNFATRAERLAAAAEVYSKHPWMELDFSDDESFRTAATDALFTLTEGALRVSAATNRVLAITGEASSASALTKTLKALNADMPKLRNVDVTGVKLRAVRAISNITEYDTGDAGFEDDTSSSSSASRPALRRRGAKQKKADPPTLPVCGILTMPYPCLVMQNGQRILEGATVGDSVVLKITADSVTITNANGRFTWKP